MGTFLHYLTVPMWSAAIFFGAVGIYDLFLARFIAELHEEERSVLKAAQSVALRQMGTFNRRFMWPSYEAKVRKRLLTAGEPAQLRPEEMMALQEIGLGVGALMGLLVGNFFQYPLLGVLLGAMLGMLYPQI